MSIEWNECHDGVGETEISRVETTLGRRFPADYRAMVGACHGGFPTRSDFQYDDPDYGESESTVGEVLSYDEDYEDNILQVFEDLRPQLPDGIVPIAHDGGGNYVSFDYRSSADAPSVVFWLHEKPQAKSIVPLASTWSEFLDQLYEPDEDDE